MYAWPKFHGSSPYSFRENDLNTKKFTQPQPPMTSMSMPEKQYICLASASQARQKLCLLEKCSQGFSKIWPSDLVFDPTGPSFELGLGIMIINILIKFHEECTQGFSKIWPSDLVFDPKWPSFILDLDIMMINILTQFHELMIKSVPSRVYTRFF